jgi:PAS domain S-box-containing protein
MEKGVACTGHFSRQAATLKHMAGSTNKTDVNCPDSGQASPTQSIAQLGAICASSDDAVLILDPSGKVACLNVAAERMLGYASSELAGQSPAVLAPLDCLDEYKDILERAVRGKCIADFETVHLAKDSRRIEVSLSAFPAVDREGPISAIRIVLHDITERKVCERALIASERFFTSTADVHWDRPGR